MLFIHTFTAIHYLQIVLPNSLFYYILVTQEPHFLLCYTGGNSLSSAPLGFYIGGTPLSSATLGFYTEGISLSSAPLAFYTGGISLSSAPLGFYTLSLDHASPVLSLQSTNSLIRTRSTNYGTEMFRSWSYTVSCSKVMSVKYAISASLMLMKIDIRQITWNLSISKCGWIETTITITLPEDLRVFLHALRA